MEEREIEDKNITIHSLFGVNKVKMVLLGFQKLGLISQKCLGEYTANTKIEHGWFIYMNMASLSIIKRVEEKIVSKIKNINTCRDGNYLFISEPRNIVVRTSDFLFLDTDHLILSMEIF